MPSCGMRSDEAAKLFSRIIGCPQEAMTTSFGGSLYHRRPHDSAQGIYGPCDPCSDETSQDDLSLISELCLPPRSGGVEDIVKFWASMNSNPSDPRNTSISSSSVR